MMNTRNVVGGLLLLVPMGDVWVDAIGGSLGGDGETPATAFLRITQGLEAASPGDAVKVKKGVYNADLGETFPLSIPSEVSVIGVDAGTTSADFAQIGGDLIDDDFSDPTVKALMVIDGRSTSREDITIQNFIFLGQDDEDFDSPPAVLFVGESQDCLIAGNKFLRGEMNDATSPDKATIVIGGLDGSIINASTVQSNVIEPSPRGSIEFAGVATGLVEVSSDFTVMGNTIQNPSGTTSEYGIHWAGLDGPLGGGANIVSNQIVSTDDGIGVGLSVEVKSFGSAASLFHPARIVGNQIEGCSGDGIYLECTITNMRIEAFARNTIKGNGGSGVHVVRDPGHDFDGEGDINNQWIEGNLIVGNGGFGYLTEGLGSASGFPMKVLNDTIADNAMGSFGFDNWDDAVDQISVAKFDELFPGFGNLIMWGNNPSGSYQQVVGLNATLLDAFIDKTSYSIWQYLPGTPADGNLDSDPNFVNAGGGNYHLDDSSPCIDSGRVSLGVTAEVDIDGEARVQDGDHPICERPPVLQIDRGADEFTDPCVE